LERVPALVTEGLAAAEKEDQHNLELPCSDLGGGPDPQTAEEDNRWARNMSAWQTLVTAYVKSRRLAEARAVLAQWGPAFEARRRRVEDHAAGLMPYDERCYHDALAQLAVAEDRKPDVLPLYQSGFRAAWSAVNRPLPELSLADQNGKTWALRDIQGKTTLMNVWATWCGPCRAELPYLQKLHEKLKDRQDVQVITFNIDENIALIEPFLKENKYTFPVLLAKSFMDGFARSSGVPANWIADRAASIRFEAEGFAMDGDKWIKQTLEQMGKAVPPTGTSSVR
jgi:thiol-disulfide isomerase/thioredoxin